jgi:hypothetical protein
MHMVLYVDIHYIHVSSEVLRAVIMNTAGFWYVTPSNGLHEVTYLQILLRTFYVALVPNCEVISGICNMWKNILCATKTFLTSARDGGKWSTSRYGRITPGEIVPDTP